MLLKIKWLSIYFAHVLCFSLPTSIHTYIHTYIHTHIHVLCFSLPTHLLTQTENSTILADCFLWTDIPGLDAGDNSVNLFTSFRPCTVLLRVYCHSHNNWGPRNSFQQFSVPVYYWKTAEKPETDFQLLWKWLCLHRVDTDRRFYDLVDCFLCTVYAPQASGFRLQASGFRLQASGFSDGLILHTCRREGPSHWQYHPL